MTQTSFVPAGSFIDLSEYSSNLRTLTWNGDGTIDVAFRKQPKAIYRYHHCPPSLWDFLLKGKETQDKHDEFSIGAAFHQEVIQKSDLYPFEKLEREGSDG